MPSRSALVQYHLYAWRRFRLLLVESVAVNYVLPALAEFLPWFLSRRLVAHRLRQIRSTVEHAVLDGRLPRSLVMSYLGSALLYSLLCALDTNLRVGVARRSRAVLERQLLQRLMSVDLQAISAVYKRLYGIETRTDLVYQRINSDLDVICETVNTTLPSAVRNLVVFVRSMVDIYPRRHQVDILAVIRPTAVAIAADLYSRLQQAWFPSPVENSQAHDDLVATIIARLAEIQAANLQSSHLNLLAKSAITYRSWNEVMSAGFDHVAKTLSGHSVVEFATEALMARRVMARVQIDHETYRKVQVDVDYCVNILRKSVSLFYQAYQGLGQSAGFTNILSLKTFRTTSPSKKSIRFDTLSITSAYFKYENGPLALKITMPVTFLSGRVYALLGPNGAGKSTLIRLLMRQIPPGPKSRLSVDGVPFTSIERYFYRSHIVYVSQRPYLIPGTVADNIRIGHPSATDNQVYEAAKLGGVFLFANQDSSAGNLSQQSDADQESMLMSQLLQQSIHSNQISSSMAQAIALSRIFLSDNHVRVIILDEALALIDSLKVHTLVWPNLLDFARIRRMMVIVVTHDPFVFNLADKVAVMQAGDIVEFGSPTDLLQNRMPAFLRIIGRSDSFSTVVDQL